jgi:hypothetical protein
VSNDDVFMSLAILSPHSSPLNWNFRPSAVISDNMAPLILFWPAGVIRRGILDTVGKMNKWTNLRRWPLETNARDEPSSLALFHFHLKIFF